MKVPKLEEMIEHEVRLNMSIVHRRNICYSRIYDKIISLDSTTPIDSSELHAMVNTSMNEPAYSVLAHEIYLSLKDKYIRDNYTVPFTIDGTVDRYLAGSLRKLLLSLMEYGYDYGLNLPG